MDRKQTALVRVMERGLLHRSTDLARESRRLALLAGRVRAARERGRRPSRNVLASVLHSEVARYALAPFLGRAEDASFDEILDAIEGSARPRVAASAASPVAQAAAIVRDATQVDWSREPQTEYERAIRAAFIAQRLDRNVPLGWIELLTMERGRRSEIASDLSAAILEAESRMRERIEERERRSLRDAREAVDSEEPEDGP